MKLNHPNNNTPPAIISFEIQEYVSDICYNASKNFEIKYNRTPDNREIYNTALNAMRNDLFIPVNRSNAEHCLWFLATNCD